VSARPLVVVQPSADYARRVRAHVPGALLLASPERCAQLEGFDAVPADLTNPAAALQALRLRLRRMGGDPGGITCFVCEHLLVTARLAAALGLPYHSVDLVQATRSKGRCAAIWQAHGVPTPPTAVVRGLDDLLAFAADYAPPWIVKPLDGSGSEWAMRAETPAQLRAAHEQLVAGLAAGRGVAPAAVAHLVQRFVEGREFGADLLVSGGEVRIARLTEKRLRRDRALAGIVEAYYFPRLSDSEQRQLGETLAAAVRALGVTWGVAMADVMLAREGPLMLEVALRPGGDCLPDLCIHATGYDPVRTACRLALGLAPDLAPPRTGRSIAALHLLSEHAGVIRRIDCSRLVADPRVVKLIEVYHAPGDEVRLWAGSYDDRILAAVLVQCDDPDELPQLSRQLAQCIDVEFEPPEESAGET